MRTLNHSACAGRLLALLLLGFALAACDGQSSGSGSTAAVASLSGTPTVQVAADSAYSFQPRSVTPAGSSLLFSIQNKPAWANFSLTSGQLSGTPSSADAGEYPGIQISASDGTSTAALPSFTIRVTPPSALLASNSTGSSSGGSSTTGSTTTGSSTTGSSTTGSSSTGSSTNGTSSSGAGSSSSSSSDTVSVSWEAPTENTDGSALTNLAGYTLYFGTSASAMTQKVSISTVGELSYVLANLGSGTWYIEVVAVNSSGIQSAPSSVVSVTI